MYGGGVPSLHGAQCTSQIGNGILLLAMPLTTVKAGSGPVRCGYTVPKCRAGTEPRYWSSVDAGPSCDTHAKAKENARSQHGHGHRTAVIAQPAQRGHSAVTSWSPHGHRTFIPARAQHRHRTGTAPHLRNHAVAEAEARLEVRDHGCVGRPEDVGERVAGQKDGAPPHKTTSGQDCLLPSPLSLFFCGGVHASARALPPTALCRGLS